MIWKNIKISINLIFIFLVYFYKKRVYNINVIKNILKFCHYLTYFKVNNITLIILVVLYSQLSFLIELVRFNRPESNCSCF